MAMSHFQPLLFFVVILFFPPFHALNFEFCNPNQSSNYIEVTDLKTHSDQPHAVTVSGLAKYTMVGSIEVGVQVGKVVYYHANLCSCLHLSDGNHFVIPVTGLPYEFAEVESKYVYLIKFWESSDEIMCIKFKMPTSATTLNGTTSVQNLELAEEAEHKEPAIV
ncbi:uncharacterized protein LOC130494633 [Raphanus sativus]|uniref:Uncharacterized protein LOC130494633 n=1 Tax=Raphanus sativus TaxID=3726 RepID=A0A9W3C9Q9_RAPSA|nr:uncharacterized protein LOC130494633 [Raphanus sativus]